MSGIGISGAQCTGKSTLACAIADKLDVKFVATRTSKIFDKHDIDPSDIMDFAERIVLQFEILTAMAQQWESYKSRGIPFVSDRSPLDCLAYTLFEVRPYELDSDDEKQLQTYTDLCYDMANNYFEGIVLVQPGIPLDHERNKPTAALEIGCMEAMNALIGGLLQDERYKGRSLCIPRRIVDLERRCKSVTKTCQPLVSGEPAPTYKLH